MNFIKSLLKIMAIKFCSKRAKKSISSYLFESEILPGHIAKDHFVELFFEFSALKLVEK